MCRSDGTVVGEVGANAPAPDHLTPVFEGAPDAVAWLVDLEVDAAGVPFALLSVQKDGAGKPRKEGGFDHRYVHARYVDGGWRTREIAYAGTRLYAGEDDYTGLGALDAADPARVVISTDADPDTGAPLISARDGERHHEIFEGRVRGDAAIEWRPITRDSVTDNLRPLIPAGNGGAWDVVLWLRGEYRSYTDYDLAVVGRIRDQRAIPGGYRLVYEQDFEDPRAIDDYRFSDAGTWKIVGDASNRWLEQTPGSTYEPKHRSPLNLAILKTPAVGSFVLDVDLMQTGRDYGHRDMCVFFGVRDPDHLYYAHLASAADDNAHQVQIVDGAARRPITAQRSTGVDWGRGTWRHVRVVRDAERGNVRVWFGGGEEPVLAVTDQTFASGFVGFGSFDDEGRIDHVRLWADGADDDMTANFFEAGRH